MPSSRWGEAHVHNLGAKSGWTALPPRKRSSADCIGGWMDPMDGLGGFGNLIPTGIRTPNRPVRSESLYWLSYPGRGRLYKFTNPSQHPRIGYVMRQPHKMNAEGWKIVLTSKKTHRISVWGDQSVDTDNYWLVPLHTDVDNYWLVPLLTDVDNYWQVPLHTGVDIGWFHYILMWTVIDWFHYILMWTLAGSTTFWCGQLLTGSTTYWCWHWLVPLHSDVDSYWLVPLYTDVDIGWFHYILMWTIIDWFHYILMWTLTGSTAYWCGHWLVPLYSDVDIDWFQHILLSSGTEPFKSRYLLEWSKNSLSFIEPKAD